MDSKALIQDIYPLSPLQEGMLFHHLADKDSDAYFEQVVFSLQEELDIPVLENCLNKLVEKYEVLRTVFSYRKAKYPRQVVLKKRSVAVNYHDVRHLKDGQIQDFLDDFKAKDRLNKFDLSRDLLLRFSLLRIAEKEYRLIWSFHHILMDGWCLGIVLRDLFDFYAKLSNGGAVNVKNDKPYSNYIKWLRSQKKDAALDYWKTYLNDYEERAGLPRIAAEASVDYSHREAHTSINRALTGPLKKIAKEQEVTISTVFQALWGILLQKYNDTDDVVFGTVVSGRTSEVPGVEEMVGLFINTVPVRVKATPGASFVEVIKDLQQKNLESTRFEYVSLAEIQSQSQLKTDLLDHIVILENYPVQKELQNMSTENNHRLKVTDMEIFEQPNYNLALMVHPGEQLSLNFIFNGNIYSEGAIARIAGHLSNLAHQVIENPQARISELQILSPSEKQQLIFDFNDTKADYSRDKTIHQLFEEQAARTPGHTAVVFDGRRWSYLELNERANQLAHLLQQRGVSVGDVVGVHVERSLEMIVAVIGILKAGGIYVPIDANLPCARVAQIMASLNVRYLLFNRVLLQKAFEISDDIPELELLICLDELAGAEVPEHESALELLTKKEIDQQSAANPAPKATAGDLAYIIHTSGSSGIPKGVILKHRPVVNIIEWVNQQFEVGASDKLLFITSLGFDLSVYDIFGILAAGATIRLVSSPDSREPSRLMEIILNEGITFWDSAPAALQRLAPFFDEVKNVDRSNTLRLVFLSGDWIPVPLPDLLRQAFKRVQVIALGGATEAAIWSNYYITGKINPRWRSIPYGKPIQNAKYFILDRHLRPCPLGVPGDLYIGGECLSSGYANEVSLTADKFINRPFTPGEILYKTGDRARWFEDGNIEFLGRKDFQVKIRGFRIELGEIEHHLQKLEWIKDAIVIAREGSDREKYLCAYIVADREIEPSSLRQHLSKTLPEYMIPAFFVRIAKIPLNQNGKVDKKQLPDPREAVNGRHVPPRSSFEAKLAEIWSDLLRIEKDKIGIDANFLELGGHSLTVTIMASRIHQEFNIKMPLVEIFRRPTIRQLADFSRTVERDVFVPIKPADQKLFYHLSSAQKRLYILQQMEKESVAYNIPAAVIIEGEIDSEKLADIFRRLILRHESLRTSFEMAAGEPVQIIHEHVPFEIERSPEGGSPDQIVRSFVRPFDLGAAPLLRVGLFKISENQQMLIIDMHHIISDGMSMDIFVRDFFQLYAGNELPPLKFQYKDYSEWQRTAEYRGLIEKQKAFWLGEFAGEIPVLNLPYDYPRPAVMSFAGDGVSFEIDGEKREQLAKLALESGATFFMLLLASFSILLSKVTNQEETIIGSPIAGRNHADLQNILGVMVNTLSFRSAPSGNKSFLEFLAEVKERSLKAFENQVFPFEDLVEQVAVNRDISRNPVFDAMFVWDEVAQPIEQIAGLKIRKYGIQNTASKFDLSLDVRVQERLHFTFTYCTKLFARDTIECFVVYLQNILSAIVADPNVLLAEIDILPESERKRILQDFNDTAAAYSEEQTIHELFEEQVQKTPDRIALLFADEQLTYRELNRRANQLAHHLRQQGVESNTIVAILAERSIEMLVGILGILKAGGVYLPLNSSYPENRIRYLLEESGAALLLAQKACDFDFENLCRVIVIAEVLAKGEDDSNPQNLTTADDLAYVLFTSGSTGKPKGVLVEHRAILNTLYCLDEWYPFCERDTYLLKTSFLFDVSLTELFGWFLHGGRLAILNPEEEKDPARMVEAIAQQEVTHLNFVPSMFEVFTQALNSGNVHQLESLKYIFLAGEALSPKLVKRFREMDVGIRLENIYGPTEAAIYASKYSLQDWRDSEVMPIGKPLRNVQLYILNRHGGVQPLGVAGELGIAGAGLARGYLNSPALTGEKFVSNPLVAGERLYRTGDLARWLPDGNIEFLGRLDHQVKLRGFRIELGEIENRLLEHPYIKDAVVIAKDGNSANDRRLCAFVVSEKVLETVDLRIYLSRELPAYMIPSYFVQVEKMPITENGKIDRRALAALNAKLDLGVKYVAPSKKHEKIVAEVWKEVLNLQQVGIHDNFFDLGGNSLKIIQLSNRLQEVLHQKIDVMSLFAFSTIYSFVENLDREKNGRKASVKGRLDAQQQGKSRLQDLKTKSKRVSSNL